MDVQRLGAASMPGRRGRASMPGSWGLAAIGKKKRAAVLPHKNWIFFLGIPTLARAWQGSDAGQVARPGASRAGWCAGRPRGCCAGVRLRICRFSLFEKLLKSLLRPVGHGS